MPSFLVLGVAVGVFGCGGGGSGNSSQPTESIATSAGPNAGKPPTGAQPPASGKRGRTEPSETSNAAPKTNRDSGGGASQFRRPGYDNSIQQFGTEAPTSSWEAAASSLHAYLDASASGRMNIACSYLAAARRSELAELVPQAHNCDGQLDILFSRTPPGAMKRAAIANVGAVRRDGDRGFILYHGTHGVDYSMPIEMEEGRWKVEAFSATPLG